MKQNADFDFERVKIRDVQAQNTKNCRFLQVTTTEFELSIKKSIVTCQKNLVPGCGQQN